MRARVINKKLDPKDSIIDRREKRTLDLIILVFSLGALYLLGVLVGTKYLSTPKVEVQSPNFTSGEVSSSVSLSSPIEGSEVDGEILVTGNISDANVKQLLVEILDMEDNLLGTQRLEINSNVFTTNLIFSVSPTTPTGYIQLSAVSGSLRKVGVNFKTSEVADRLIVRGPIENQIISEDFKFVAEMKGFFEGTMNVRVKGSNGATLLDNAITANADNYEEFVTVSEELTIPNFDSITSASGTLEVYEISAKDGSERVLVSFPVRF